jgi:hypothetical protein
MLGCRPSVQHKTAKKRGTALKTVSPGRLCLRPVWESAAACLLLLTPDGVYGEHLLSSNWASQRQQLTSGHLGLANLTIENAKLKEIPRIPSLFSQSWPRVRETVPQPRRRLGPDARAERGRAPMSVAGANQEGMLAKHRARGTGDSPTRQ